MSALCFLYLFLKLVTELAIFIVEGILFHSSTTLIEKKFLLTSSRAACCLKLSGPVALHSCCQVGLVSRAPQQCCRFGMFIPDPDFFHPRSNNRNKRLGGGQFLVLPYFVIQISQNWKLFYFLTGTGKNLSKLTKNSSTFFPKNCHYDLNHRTLDPGSKMAVYPRSGSAILVQRGWRGQTIRLRMLPKNI
jgi:hypothetical protein